MSQLVSLIKNVGKGEAMPDQTPQSQYNPYEPPKHAGARRRFSILTFAVIAMVLLTTVGAGAFIVKRAADKSLKMNIQRGPALQVLDTPSVDQ